MENAASNPWIPRGTFPPGARNSWEDWDEGRSPRAHRDVAPSFEGKSAIFRFEGTWPLGPPTMDGVDLHGARPKY